MEAIDFIALFLKLTMNLEDYLILFNKSSLRLLSADIPKPLLIFYWSFEKKTGRTWVKRKLIISWLLASKGNQSPASSVSWMEALSLLNPHLNIVSNIFSSLNTENGKMFKAIVVKYSSLKRCRKSATAYSSVILVASNQ